MQEQLTNIIVAALVLAFNQILNIIRTQYQSKKENKKIEEFYAALEEIRKQVFPNGGSSLNDKITALVNKIEKVDLIYENLWYLELDRSSTPIYMSNEKGDYVFVNKAITKLFRLSKEEMLGQGWLKRIKNKPQAFRNYEEALKNNIPYTDTYELVDDNGEVYATCNSTSVIYKDLKGRFLFSYGEIKQIK